MELTKEDLKQEELKLKDTVKEIDYQIENAGINAKGKTVLVLGTGGVGRTVIKKLVTSGATVSAFD